MGKSNGKKIPAQWILNHPELNAGDFGPIIRTDAMGNNAEEFTSVNEASGNVPVDAGKIRERLRSIFLPDGRIGYRIFYKNHWYHWKNRSRDDHFPGLTIKRTRKKEGEKAEKNEEEEGADAIVFHSIAECAIYTKNMNFDIPLRKFYVQLSSANVNSTFSCHGFQWTLVGVEKKKKGRQDMYSIRLTDLRTKESKIMPTMTAAFAETQLQEGGKPTVTFDINFHLSGFKFEILGRGETFQVGSRSRRQFDKTVPASDVAVKPPVKDVLASLQDDAEEVMDAEVLVDEWNSPTAEYKTPKTIRKYDDIVLRDRALQLPAIVYSSPDIAGKNLFLRYGVDTLGLNPKSMLVRFPPNNNGYKKQTGCTDLGDACIIPPEALCNLRKVLEIEIKLCTVRNENGDYSLFVSGIDPDNCDFVIIFCFLYSVSHAMWDELESRCTSAMVKPYFRVSDVDFSRDARELPDLLDPNSLRRMFVAIVRSDHPRITKEGKLALPVCKRIGTNHDLEANMFRYNDKGAILAFGDHFAHSLAYQSAALNPKNNQKQRNELIDAVYAKVAAKSAASAAKAVEEADSAVAEEESDSKPEAHEVAAVEPTRRSTSRRFVTAVQRSEFDQQKPAAKKPRKSSFFEESDDASSSSESTWSKEELET